MASIYHKPGERPFVLPCSIFGGRSPITGNPVGARHRWSGGDGRGACDFCGRYKEEVMSKPQAPNRTLDGVFSSVTPQTKQAGV